MEARAPKRKLPDDFVRSSKYRSKEVSIEDIPLELWRTNIFPRLTDDDGQMDWMPVRGVPILWKKLAQCYIDVVSERAWTNRHDEVISPSLHCLSGMLYMFIDFASTELPCSYYQITHNERIQIEQQFGKMLRLLNTVTDDVDTRTVIVRYLLQTLRDPTCSPPHFVSAQRKSWMSTVPDYMPLRLIAKHRPQSFRAMVRHWFKHFGSTKGTSIHVSEFAQLGKQSGIKSWPLFVEARSGSSAQSIAISRISKVVVEELERKDQSPIQLFPLVLLLVLSKTCSIAMQDTLIVSDIADVLCSPVGYMMEGRHIRDCSRRNSRYLYLWDKLTSVALPPSVSDMLLRPANNAFALEGSIQPSLSDWLTLLFRVGYDNEPINDVLAVKLTKSLLRLAERCDGRSTLVPETAVRIAVAAATYDMPGVLTEVLPVCATYERVGSQTLPSPMTEWVSSGYLAILETIVSCRHSRLIAPFIAHIRTTSLSDAIVVIYSFLHLGMSWEPDVIAQAGAILHNPAVLAILVKQSNVQSFLRAPYHRFSRRKAVSDMFPDKIGKTLLSGIATDIAQDVCRSPRTWVECVLACSADDITFRCGLLFAYLEVVAPRISQRDCDDIFDALLSSSSSARCENVPLKYIAMYLPLLQPSLTVFHKHWRFMLESSVPREEIREYIFSQLAKDPYAPQIVTMTTDAIRSLSFDCVTIHILPVVKKIGKFRPHVLEYYKSLCHGVANEARKCAEAFGQSSVGASVGDFMLSLE